MRVGADALATRDKDRLHHTRQQVSFVTTLKRLDSSLIGTFRKADKTFRVRPDPLQTAFNDDGVEIDLMRRPAIDSDPHPLPMSTNGDDLRAVQVPSGKPWGSGRRFERMVVSPRGIWP